MDESMNEWNTEPLFRQKWKETDTGLKKWFKMKTEIKMYIKKNNRLCKLIFTSLQQKRQPRAEKNENRFYKSTQEKKTFFLKSREHI